MVTPGVIVGKAFNSPDLTILRFSGCSSPEIFEVVVPKYRVRSRRSAVLRPCDVRSNVDSVEVAIPRSAATVANVFPVCVAGHAGADQFSS